MLNLKQIVENWLNNASYDGLYGEYCECAVDDLMPCGEPNVDCLPGRKMDCPGPNLCEIPGDCHIHIGP